MAGMPDWTRTSRPSTGEAAVAAFAVRSGGSSVWYEPSPGGASPAYGSPAAGGAPPSPAGSARSFTASRTRPGPWEAVRAVMTATASTVVRSPLRARPENRRRDRRTDMGVTPVGSV
ncbi:hypothetical protein GCM10019016_040770 [Streptomyces prasinosporus]|uniref:Uncharacterized protein n=1 Tax=Streptomyces prasinosporus TaxID=68256 RepID=A0ABP6TS90_9ACTN